LATVTHTNNTALSFGSKRRLKLWFIIVALFMSWALYTFITQIERQSDAQYKLAEVQGKIDAATKQIQDLNLMVNRLSDNEYLGDLATKEQGMVKRGEKQIIPVD
jgi:cell division protein DivIC